MPDATPVAAVYDRRASPTTQAVTDRRYRLLSLPARLLSALIWLYQRGISPALAALNPTCGCRFAPTCSHYAREALATHGFFLGTFFALRRLAKCGPWHPGGDDPVPPRARPVCHKLSSSV